MSIIREHTQATLSDAWRTIDIDALEEDSPANFDTSALRPAPVPEVGEADVRQLTAQVRQLLRGGDAEGALRGCLETPVYCTSTAASTAGGVGAGAGAGGGSGSGSGNELAREAHLQIVMEVLQSIKASEMTPVLQRIYGSPGGSECLDVLMKYLYKGMASASSSSSASSSALGGGGTGAGSAPRTPTRMTPQQTGFSQIGARPGAPTESTGAAMSVLLSWHEKVVEVAGLGCIGRVMTDWRRV